MVEHRITVDHILCLCLHSKKNQRLIPIMKLFPIRLHIQITALLTWEKAGFQATMVKPTKIIFRCSIEESNPLCTIPTGPDAYLH